MTNTTKHCSTFDAEEPHAEQLRTHERRTRWVVVITFVMMVAELIVGTLTRSLALTADGWHMATHAGALALTSAAYWFARTRARESTFSFGTGKVFALAAYTNAVVLLLVALYMAYEGVSRLLAPVAIRFSDALPVAVIGLVVNVATMALLVPTTVNGGTSPMGHPHDHGSHGHGHHSHAGHSGHAHGPSNDAHGGGADLNLRAAYMHIAADALTSVFAIGALVGGRYLGWTVLDPLMAIVGSVVILRWSVGLCRQSARQLLDVVWSPDVATAIRARLEAMEGVRVVDLHLWELGAGRRSCIVSLVSEAPRPLEEYRAAVLGAASVEHLTVEVLHAENQASFS